MSQGAVRNSFKGSSDDGRLKMELNHVALFICTFCVAARSSKERLNEMVISYVETAFYTMLYNTFYLYKRVHLLTKFAVRRSDEYLVEVKTCRKDISDK